MFGLLLLFLLAVPASALTLDQAAVGAAADESACSLSLPGVRFASTQDQVYFRFVARRIRAGERLTVEWLDPQGRVHTSAAYDQLPAAPSLCFLTGLPLGGFPAAQLPGVWTVRVVVDGRVTLARTFEVTGVVDAAGPRVTDVDRTAIEGKQTEVEIRGAGFLSDSVVNIAQYTKEGGWNYIAMLIPAGTTDERMVVRLPELPVAEYLVIVRNPDGRESPPARFLVASPADYKLPTPEGVPWTITQGPYGGFSHYGRSRHAWDIAPKAGACLVAMRAGTAFTFDLGFGQTPGRRIFGNYITVQHDDGEFSHYGHLQTGTFRVRNGQRVEQGQPLATAGNSGYTVGQGGGHHVHVHVTKAFSISSPSIPFQFGDLPGHAARAKYVTVSSTNRVAGDCDTTTNGESYTGSVAVTEVWSQFVTVAKGTRSLEVRLEGGTRDASLDLSLVSPSGRHYATYAEAGGFDGGGARFRAADPEPGSWRVLVRGMRGGGERVEFRVTAELAAPPGKQKGRRAGAAGTGPSGYNRRGGARHVADNNPGNDQLQRALQRISDDIGDLRSDVQAAEQRTQEFVRDAVKASEQRILDATQELVRDAIEKSELQLTKLVRDTETNLLNGFFLFQEHEKIQFQRLKADSGNALRAGELRIDNREQRILELERRILRRRDDDAAPLPS